jgi:hypothetical protein
VVDNLDRLRSEQMTSRPTRLNANDAIACVVTHEAAMRDRFFFGHRRRRLRCRGSFALAQGENHFLLFLPGCAASLFIAR